MAMRPYAQRPCPSHRRRKAMTSNAASPLPCRSFARMHLCACKKRRRVPYTAPTNAVYEALLHKQDGSFFAAHPQAKPRYHIPREKATLPYGIRNGISRCGQRHAAAKTVGIVACRIRTGPTRVMSTATPGPYGDTNGPNRPFNLQRTPSCAGITATIQQMLPSGGGIPCISSIRAACFPPFAPPAPAENLTFQPESISSVVTGCPCTTAP